MRPIPIPFDHNWPLPLRRLCETHGEETVYFEGLAILGYPPTWNPTGRDINTIVATMNVRKGDGEV